MKNLSLMRITTLVWVLLLALTIPTFAAYENEWIESVGYDKTYYKFKTDHDGLHRISYSTLNSSGINLNGSNFKLFSRGEEIPIYVTTSGFFGSSDYIEFYGETNDCYFDIQLYEDEDHVPNPYFSNFETEGTYFLVSDPSGGGIRYLNTSNDISSVPSAEQYFMYTAAVDNANIFHFGRPKTGVGSALSLTAQFGEGEGWSSTNVAYNTLGGNVVNSKNYKVDTRGAYAAAGIDATLDTRLVGKNQNSGVYFDKLLQIEVNDNIYLDTQAPGTPTSMLMSGYQTKDYQLTIDINDLDALDDTRVYYYAWDGVSNSGFPIITQYAVGYVSLTYPRNFNLYNEKSFMMELDVPSTKYFEISGFNGGAAPIIYDLTSMQRIIPVFSGGLYKFKLSPTSETTRRIFISNTTSSGVVENVTSLEAKNYTDYSNVANQGNYILIYNSQLESGCGTNQIQRYVNYRSSVQGGSYNVVPVEIQELYDQYAHGIDRHVMAIKNFTHQASDEWTIEPDFLFLVGKGVQYNIHRYIPDAKADCLVPSYGHRASDLMLVSTSTQNFAPVMSVGRIPVFNCSELDVYIDKVEEYEVLYNAPCDLETREWMDNALHLAKGWGDETEGFVETLDVFKDIIENPPMNMDVVATFENDVDVKIPTSVDCGNALVNYLDVNSAYYHLEPIQPLIEDGVNLVTYVGHSYGHWWQYDFGYPSDHDNEGKYPFILSNSCFVGKINDYVTCNGDYLPSMAEQWTLYDNGGSIAFLAAVALSTPSFLEIYSSALMENLSSDEFFGQPIGLSVEQTVLDMIFKIQTGQLTGQDAEAAEITCYEFTYTGDPAIKLYNFINPEFYLESGDVSVSDSNINSSSDSSYDVYFTYNNMGNVAQDNVIVNVTQTHPSSGQTVFTQNFTIDDPVDGVTYTLLVPVSQGSNDGLNTVTVTVNPGNIAEEDCYDNNEASLSINVTNPDCNGATYSISIPGISNVYCQDDGIVTLTATAPEAGFNVNNGSFTINGVSATSINPAMLSAGSYSINYTYVDPASGCGSNGFESFTISESPDADFSLSGLLGGITLCEENDLIVSFTGSAANGADFNWNFGTGGNASLIGTNQYAVSYSSIGSKTISLTIDNNNGCVDFYSQQINIEAALPAPNVSCQQSGVQGSVTVAWDDIPGVTIYLVSVNGGAPNTQTNNSYTYAAGPGTAVTFEIQAYGNGACGSSVESVIECTAASCQPEDITLSSTPNSVCQNDVAFGLSASPSGGVFEIIGNGNIIQTNTFNPAALSAGVYTISYEYIAPDGCITIETAEVDVMASPNPVIIGDLEICPGESATLGLQNNYQSVTWNGTTTAATYTVNSPGTYLLNVVDFNGCSSITSFEVVVDQNSSPSASFNADKNQACLGDSFVFTNTSTNYENPNWVFTNTSNGTSVSSTDDNPIFNPTTAGTYNVSLQVEGCANVSVYDETITVNDLPTLELSDNLLSVCEGEIFNVSTTISGTGTVNWTGNGIISTAGNTLMASTTTNQAYTATYIDGNGCSTTETLQVEISTDNEPSASFNVTGESYCIGDVIEIDNLSANAVSSTWQVTNQETSEVLTFNNTDVSFTALDAGEYNVTLFIDGCGSSNDVAFESSAFTINQVVDFTYEILTTDACDGQEVEIQLSDTEDVESYEFTGNSVDFDAATLIVTAIAGEGTITINGIAGTVTGPGGFCDKTVSIDIVGAEGPEITFVEQPTEACLGTTITFSVEETAGYQYSWIGADLNETSGSSVTANIQIASSYQVEVISDEGCVTTESFFVDLKPGPDFDVVSDAAVDVCAGSEVELSIENEDGTYTYSWAGDGLMQNTGTTVNAIVGEGTQTYTVIAESTDGCTSEREVTVTAQNGPEINLTVPATACAGSTITFELQPQLNTTYTWAGVGLIQTTGSVVTATIADDQIFSVLAQNNSTDCQKTETFEVVIIDSPYFEVATNSGNAACTGDIIQINVENSTGGLDFTWSGVGLQQTAGNTVDYEVQEGQTTITVMGASGAGCEFETTIDITGSEALPIDLIAPEESCVGAPIVLTASTTDADATYTWSGDGLNQTNGQTVTANLNETGTYSVTVSFSNGCERVEMVDVEAVALPVFEINSVIGLVACQDEVVALDIINAADDYTYTWIGDGLLQSAGNTVSYVVQSGTETITVVGENDKGCAISNTIEFNGIDVPTFNIDAPVTACDDSEITLEADFFAGADYTWSGNGLNQTSGQIVTADIANGIDGEFFVTIDFINGCSRTQSVNIQNIEAPTFNLNSSDGNLVCSGETITLSADNFTYDYVWLGTGITNIENNTADLFVSEGVQTVFVTANNGQGCTYETEITITGKAAPEVVLDAPEAVCVGDMATLSVDEITNAEYYWSGPGLNETGASIEVSIENSGLYTVLIIDEDNCQSSETFTVEAEPIPTFDLVSAAGTQVCANQTISLEIENASTDLDYEWQGDGLETTSGNQVNANISLGNQVFTVLGTSALGCEYETTITIEGRDAPTIVFDEVDEVCENEESVLSIQTEDAIVYTWELEGTQVAIDSEIIVNLSETTTYTVYAEDEFGCIAQSELTVDVAAKPVFDVNYPSSICAGDGVELQAVSEDENVTYTWLGYGLESEEGQNVSTFIPESVTGDVSFTVTAENDKGCIEVMEITVASNARPEVTIITTDIDGVVCSGEDFNLNVTTTASNITWSGGLLEGNTNTEVSTSIAGITVFTVTAMDENGCEKSQDITIDVHEDFEVNVPSDVSVCAGNATTIVLDDGLSLAVEDGIDVTVTAIEGGFEVVANEDAQLIVTETDDNGCFKNAEFSLFLDDSLCETIKDMEVPNVITPNGDGRNDTWILSDLLSQYPDNEVHIYNRWGELLYEQIGYLDQWGGMRKGNELPDGTYYYLIHLNDEAGEILSGTVTIVR